jgi:hypothetical protein
MASCVNKSLSAYAYSLQSTPRFFERYEYGMLMTAGSNLQFN